MSDAPGKPNDGVQEGHQMPASNANHPDFCQLLMGDKEGCKLGSTTEQIMHNFENNAVKFLGNNASVEKPVVAEATEPGKNSAVASDGTINFPAIATYEGYSGNMSGGHSQDVAAETDARFANMYAKAA